MKTNESVSGAEPGDLDRLLALGLDDETEEYAFSASFGQLIEKPGGLIGRYKLLRVLGEGGMGVVYLAEQIEPVKREVALKVIKPGMDSRRVLGRFEAEQQALALLEHPHVARVYDAGMAPSGRPYFVMEYVKGMSITEHCDKHRLTVEQRLHLFLHVCEAVQHAHQKGIIHRDIKPSNILVTVQNNQMIPKVIDFGVARALNQPLIEQTLFTEQGQLVGTPEYMSPEQVDLDNQDIDTRTDVYSLGVLLHELLTGMLPFDRQTFREKGIEHIRKVICELDPKTPSTRLSRTSVEESTQLAQKRRTEVRKLQLKLRGDLDWITLKALEKNRTRRYAGVDSMATDIRNYLNHLPVSAAPPGPVYKAKKFIRRHRQAAIVLTMMALMIVGGCLALIMYGRAKKEYIYAQSLEHKRLLTNAQQLAGNKKLDEALKDLNLILNSPHVDRQAKLLYAQILIEKNDITSAITALVDLIGRSDEIAGQAHFLLANIYNETDPWAPGKTQEYVTKYEHHRGQAERLISEPALYYYLQAKAESIVKRKLELLTKALTLDKQHYESLRERAYIYYAQKDYRRVGRDAARMIGLRSGNPTGYLFSALAAREQGLFEEAINDHNEAIMLDPEDPDLYEQRRETYMRMGRYALALADAQRASRLDPENLSHHVRVFMALVALKEYEQAKRQYERVISEPWAQTEYSPWAWAEGSWNTKDWFCFLTRAYTSDALSLSQNYPYSIEDCNCIALQTIQEAANYYKRLNMRATRVIAKGFSPSWSPDNTKIAYTQGALGASAVAILDLKTGATELLTMPGKDPAWSPDGRYIAFVRDRQSLSIDSFAEPADAMENDRIKGRPNYEPVQEIWMIHTTSHNIQYIVKGWLPIWSTDSRRLYYRSHPESSALCYVSIDDDQLKPKTILQSSSSFPMISPDERYVAYSEFRSLNVLEVQEQRRTFTWTAPPFPYRGLLYEWRQDGQEMAIGGWHGTKMGLWILDMRTCKASRMIDGQVTRGRWSPNCSRMTISLGHPYWEIWLADLDPNRPTAEAFGNARTEKQHCLELIERCDRYIAIDPNSIDNHLCRTDAALWIKDSRAVEYLEDLEQVFRHTPYHAGGCYQRAKAILSSSKELRDKLMPLALLLARMAVEKEPNNIEFQKVLDEVLHLQR
jgi:serine/threonine protein kinase